MEHIRDVLSHALNDSLKTPENLREPPFDSPIETAFAETCFKLLSKSVKVVKQSEISTSHGVFRVDFLIVINGRRIAIECDGKDFHETLRDEMRDAILLGEGHCETIYHLRGCDIVYYTYDCIWLMSVLDNDLFTRRGHLQLDKLRCPNSEVSDQKAMEDESFVINIDPPVRFLWVFRRSVILASKNPRLAYYWKTLYKFACEHPSFSLDELLDLRRSRWLIEQRQAESGTKNL